MKVSAFIGVAALAIACGRSHQSDTTGASTATTSSSATNASAQGQQTVTLVGCLTGPAVAAGPTGTTGASSAAAKARETTPPLPEVGMPDAAANNRFMLMHATPEGANVAGVGANGTGGSGGPVVSGESNFELDGVPPAARGDINKRVRIVGRIDARPAAPADRPELPSGSSAGTASPANAIGAGAGHGNMGEAAEASGNDARARRLVVEDVQLVAEKCDQRP